MEDQDACNLIAVSVGSIMRQSLDNNFKEECKKLLGATNTMEVEEILSKKLMEAIQNGNRSLTQQEPSTNTAISTAPPQEPPRNQNATTPLSEYPTGIISNIRKDIQLNELYNQRIQHRKRSVSPQPKVEPKSKFSFSRGSFSSAPF